MGEDKIVITISKKFHAEAKPLKGREAVITVNTDAYDEIDYDEIMKRGLIR